MTPATRDRTDRRRISSRRPDRPGRQGGIPIPLDSSAFPTNELRRSPPRRPRVVTRGEPSSRSLKMNLRARLALRVAFAPRRRMDRAGLGARAAGGSPRHVRHLPICECYIWEVSRAAHEGMSLMRTYFQVQPKHTSAFWRINHERGWLDRVMRQKHVTRRARFVDRTPGYA